MGRWKIAVLAVCAVAGCAKTPEATLSVHDAWIRLPAVDGRPGAAYFTVSGGSADDRLLKVSSPAVSGIELHEGGMANGRMTMRPIDGIDVPKGAEVKLAPGGNHAMVYGIDRTAAGGGELPLTFAFRSGANLTVEARLVPAGATGPGEPAAH